MSKASDVYDALVTKMITLFPTYYRIANPYDIQANPDTLLKQAFGIAIGPGTNTERFVGCLSTWEGSYNIGIIRQVVNTENDATGKASKEKVLLEAVQTILEAIETDPSLGGVAIKAVVNDHSGIQYIKGRQSNFLAIEVGLSVEYSETL